MDKVIVYVDDAAYAQQVLAPLCGRPASANTHWVLVACAPRMTHRVSKWVSHSTRENWRTKWADKLFAQIVPTLDAPSGAVTTVVAKGPLAFLRERGCDAYQGYLCSRPVPADEFVALLLAQAEPAATEQG